MSSPTTSAVGTLAPITRPSSFPWPLTLSLHTSTAPRSFSTLTFRREDFVLLTHFLSTLYRSSTALAQPQCYPSFVSSLIRPHHLSASPHLRPWYAMEPEDSLEVVPLLLFTLQAPSPACVSPDHLIICCVLGLFHVLIPNHPEQVEWCVRTPLVSKDPLHRVRHLRGHLN